MTLRTIFLLAALLLSLNGQGPGLVVAQERLAAEAGAQVLREGGNAVDAAVTTAFALAVTHPAAGNLGGGGFLLHRKAGGQAEFLDFREKAPQRAHPRMFLKDGKYDAALHHDSIISVGVPGTVAGLHLAWQRHGKLPWRRLLRPAIDLAKNGITVTPTLAKSLEKILPEFRQHPPTLAQFSRRGTPLVPGDLLRQPDLARTLERLARRGPGDFYHGETARLLVAEMRKNGGLITAKDLRGYRAQVRVPLHGSYRDLDVLTAAPPSGGGAVLLEALNILEGYDLKSLGAESPGFLHIAAEALRRAFADRARWIGDPDFVPDIPLERLTSKQYAADLRRSIRLDRASSSNPTRFEWPTESSETTHLSVLDRAGDAVSLTYTLEDSYGARRIVPGAGFLLNNEMGDFNAEPGVTDRDGLIGTDPNLAVPGKRMLSSMTPTIVTRAGKVVLVTGSPGGRTIPNTVLATILYAVDFGMDAQGILAAPRFHHQWLPDRLQLERGRFPEATEKALEAMGHKLTRTVSIGVAQIILARDGRAAGAADRNRYAESWVAEE